MGNKVTVKVTAEGEGLTYEWYIKNNGSKKYSKSSVTKSTYSTTMNDKAKDRLVFCRIYDQYGNMVQTKTVRLREAVSLTSQPSASAIYAQSTLEWVMKQQVNFIQMMMLFAVLSILSKYRKEFLSGKVEAAV